MYLDRRIREHDLLQTIARVNRTARGKDYGLIVDYVGLTRHLSEALGEYEETPDPPMIDLKNELPKLRDSHARVLKLFLDNGINDITDIEACVDLLEDIPIRAKFINRLKDFLTKFAMLASFPEAAVYRKDVKILGFITAAARHTYYDETMNLHGVQPKVKALIDEFVAANGIDPKIAPINILDIKFDEDSSVIKKPKTRASRMIHALRHIISIKFQDNPAFYKKISEKIEHILENLQENWDAIIIELSELTESLRSKEGEEIPGLDLNKQVPFYSLIIAELEDNKQLLGEDVKKQILKFTVDLVDEIAENISRKGFWRDKISRTNLENSVYRKLKRERLFPNEKLVHLASNIVDLAKNRHQHLKK